MQTAYTETARYYDKLYAQKDYAGEIDRLLALLPPARTAEKATLLDVACGTGRHLEHLRRHFHVEGLDLCADLLAVAQARLPEITFHLGDMFSFDLGRQYDIVTCLFSSIGYAKNIDRLRAAVGSMTQHVKPDGRLVIEPWFTPEDWKPNTVHGLYIDEPELKIARVNTSFVEGKVSIFDLHHLIGTPAGTEHVVERHEMGLFEIEEMTLAMEAAGLSVVYDAEGVSGRGLYIGRHSNPAAH